MTCPRDLTQGQVVGTSKLVCNCLQNGEKQEKSSAAYYEKWINMFFFEILWGKIKIISWLICITRKNRKSQLMEAGCYGFMRTICLRRKKPSHIENIAPISKTRRPLLGSDRAQITTAWERVVRDYQLQWSSLPPLLSCAHIWWRNKILRQIEWTFIIENFT